MATGSSSTITSLIGGWPAISRSLERFPGQDHSINALPFPKRATLSVAAGFFTRFQHDPAALQADVMKAIALAAPPVSIEARSESKNTHALRRQAVWPVNTG